ALEGARARLPVAPPADPRGPRFGARLRRDRRRHRARAPAPAWRHRAPDDGQVSAAEFEQMKRDLEIEPAASRKGRPSRLSRSLAHTDEDELETATPTAGDGATRTKLPQRRTKLPQRQADAPSQREGKLPQRESRLP